MAQTNTEQAITIPTITETAFSVDLPITSVDEDGLGRREFAARLANALRNSHSQAALVVALYGDWGSGKSSIKNMALETLRRDAATCPTIIEFNPWQISSQNSLARAFFHEIEIGLGRSNPKETRQVVKARVSKWKKYESYLELGSTISTPLGVVSTAVGAPWAGIAGTALGKILKQAADATKKGAKAIEARENAADQSLAKLKREVAEELKKLPKPLLVILDDVDRLAKEEICLLFQLVKANADFPNIVYLVLAQREIVTEALNTIAPGRGDIFLEKIVQVGLNVPSIVGKKVQEVLVRGLLVELEKPGLEHHFDKARWQNTALLLYPYFRNLRDVKRYLSSLSFHIELFRNEQSFEVDPVDLFTLEVIRVFEPEFYVTLAGSKGFLVGGIDTAIDQLQRAIKRKPKEDHREKLLAEVPSERRDRVREIMAILFPVSNNSLSVRHAGEEQFLSFRLCSPSWFDRYFLFSVPDDQISRATLEHLLSVTDRTSLNQIFALIVDRGHLEQTLDYVYSAQTQLSGAHLTSLITALLEIRLENRTYNYFLERNPAERIVHIIFDRLSQEPDETKRCEIVSTAIDDANALYLPVRMSHNLFHHVETYDSAASADDPPFITDPACISALRQKSLSKIRHAVKTSILHKEFELQQILEFWKYLAPDEPVNWLRELLTHKEGVLIFLQAMVASVSSLSGTSDERNIFIRYKYIESFLPMEEVETLIAASQFEGSNQPGDLADKDARIIEAFQRALERYKAGRSDDPL